MTDDEVRQWLSDTECHRFQHDAAVDDICGMVQVDSRAPLLRTLAETRKALAACEAQACEDGCGFCGEYNQPVRHKPDCIFATLPRPRET
jgi:hypothetical protein